MARLDWRLCALDFFSSQSLPLSSIVAQKESVPGWTLLLAVGIKGDVLLSSLESGWLAP